MSTISLPELPKGMEFEEYISALFQSAGYYIERKIIKREVEEVLELDIITTDYDSSPPEIKLLEVKSGDWGFKDLFKVRGWMDYLNISKGLFIVSKEKDKINFYKQIAKKLNIDLVIVSDLSESKETLSELISNEGIKDVDISFWRFSYWVERNLLKRLNHKKKSNPDKKCFKALEDYYFEVNSGIFFTEEITQKVNSLYSTFQKFPHISAKCGNELIGRTFDEECDTVPQQIYKDAYYKCIYNDIQVSTFIEHRARLAILKNAIDYKLYNKADIKKVEVATIIISGKEFPLIIEHILPSSFIEGLNTISKHQYFHRYPIFWQWFMWLFGGFILKDYKEEEYKILSQKTGIPIDEIPKAMESYGILFPRKDGWFMDLSSTSDVNIKMMKMFPVPLMGIGVNYRRFLYTKSRRFKDLKLTGIYTLNELFKWINLTTEVLKNG